MSLAILTLAGCSGYTPPSSTTTVTTSGITTRAFVSNAGFASGNIPASNLQIVNFTKDTLATQTINLVGNPQLMALSPNRATVMVFDAGVNQLSLVDTAKEIATPTIQLPAAATSMVVAPNNTTGYVAMRNAGTGAVAVIDIVNNNISLEISVPNARRLALSHDGKTLLAFGDGSDFIIVINTTNNSQSLVSGGLDQPVDAVFSSDDSTAYILNCGPECGGTAASVVPLNVATMTLGTPLPLPGGATVGFLNNATLYVAGSCGSGCPGAASTFGRLSVINTAGMTVSAVVPISDGFHNHIEMTGNNKLYIGAGNVAFSNGSASTCTGSTQGCLTMFNMTGNTAVISGPLGQVTGIAPISGTSKVYVCEGGELEIYDDTVDALQATQIDIVGQAYDVKQIDQ